MSGDVHTPTNAGPTGTEGATGPAGTDAASGSFGTSAGAHGIEAQPADKPEVRVGAAFAGGLAVALVLRRILGRGD